MAAARPTTKKDSGDSPELVSYRLQQVEAAVRDLTTKFDKQDTIKKSDLTEFREAIVGRITDIKIDIQRQIDEKADKTELTDLKKLVYAGGAFLGSLFTAAFMYLLSRGH